jgi:hypothetical protein
MNRIQIVLLPIILMISSVSYGVEFGGESAGGSMPMGPLVPRFDYEYDCTISWLVDAKDQELTLYRAKFKMSSLDLDDSKPALLLEDLAWTVGRGRSMDPFSEMVSPRPIEKAQLGFLKNDVRPHQFVFYFEYREGITAVTGPESYEVMSRFTYNLYKNGEYYAQSSSVAHDLMSESEIKVEGSISSYPNKEIGEKMPYWPSIRYGVKCKKK